MASAPARSCRVVAYEGFRLYGRKWNDDDRCSDCSGTGLGGACLNVSSGNNCASPDVIEGFYITLDDVRARSDELYDALARAAGDPITEADFVGRRLPDKVVPEDTDRDLLQGLFSVLDMNSDGELTRAEWNKRIESDLVFADANEDGRITLQELSNARENIGIGDALGLIF